MTPTIEVDYILHDCVFAIGQAIGTDKTVDHEAVAWIRTRYRDTFVHAIADNGNSWSHDRHRVTAVGRYLGQRALVHAGGRDTIDLDTMIKASTDVERGCRMNAEREASLPSQV